MLGWKKGHQPEKAAEMHVGDRIAIKRMKGKGQTGIRIMHLGIIKGLILEADKVICTVDWVATNLNRNIAESRGCFQSIHGPFEHDELGARSFLFVVMPGEWLCFAAQNTADLRSIRVPRMTPRTNSV
jgi:hypothetical protein